METYSERIGEALDSAVRDAVSGKKVAVAFSGGLDSGLVAALAAKYAESVVLYTAGSDVSYDVINSRDASSKMGLPWIHIPLHEGNIETILREMVRFTGTTSPLTLSFEVPTFCVTKGSEEKFILGGMGSDELFAGYHKYMGMPEEEFRRNSAEDMEKLMTEVVEHEDKVAVASGKTMIRPFTSPEVQNVARSIPFGILEPKDESSRKAVLKVLALSWGLDFIADKSKKAAQYGSGATDLIKATAKRKGMTQHQYISMICKEELD
ncbi:MAG: asparagine synthase-related protein [Methanomassiliicoccaceae archaeon]|nr:asparagine synthase-related protein [Methanomassiliicoccaceae archaeon]